MRKIPEKVVQIDFLLMETREVYFGNSFRLPRSETATKLLLLEESKKLASARVLTLALVAMR